jgi:hypothetical protein
MIVSDEMCPDIDHRKLVQQFQCSDSRRQRELIEQGYRQYTPKGGSVREEILYHTDRLRDYFGSLSALHLTCLKAPKLADLRCGTLFMCTDVCAACINELVLGNGTYFSAFDSFRSLWRALYYLQLLLWHDAKADQDVSAPIHILYFASIVLCCVLGREKSHTLEPQWQSVATDLIPMIDFGMADTTILAEQIADRVAAESERIRTAS